MALGDVAIEALGKGFQVNIGGVYVAIEFLARARVHVAGGDGNGLDALGTADLRDIHGIFKENHRVVIGEGNGTAAELLGRAHDHFRSAGGCDTIHLSAFGNAPILAEIAGEVAAGGAEGQHRRAGQKVIERFFLNWVHAKAGGPAIGGQHHAIRRRAAHETQPALAIAHLAFARADIAAKAAIR